MTTGSVSPRRADTRRNHELILTAAASSLANSGAVSFNAIAKQAGVGVGTVYRHFPTPEELILAVYDREVTHLVEVIPQLLGEHDPEQAFRVWVSDHLAHYMMTKRGLAKALSASRSELPSSAHERMIEAISSLLEANAEAGTIRRDVSPETVLRGLAGLFYLDPDSDWKTQTADLTELIWRGIRC
ncbi:TetR/AcrR family transcriptional regulator [Saccharopolyspora halophila]|uniref:TetR/AcrR family transcriptional regulator n=1 Tax=Saccharopolyspora halophila TaxID=405551 RepID=A0ABN3GA04_9PSEU